MKLKRFHPSTVIRELGDGEKPFTLADAAGDVLVPGSTGSGKTSGSGRFLALGYLASASEMGMLILCAKPDEKDQWVKWAEEAGRGKDLMLDASGENEE